MSSINDINLILKAVGRGESKATEELFPLVYEELRRMAAVRMAGEAAGHTLQPTALVHEAWLQLVGEGDQVWQNRRHFFGAAAEAMRRILIDNARRKHAQRHGGGQPRLDLAEVEVAAPGKEEEVLAVDGALEKFAALEPQKAELVKLRYFAGLSIVEAAQILGISVPTANRWWTYARAWLFQEIRSGQ